MENTELTPKQIVERLDQYIIGQKDAKRAVAVALRNRFRRLKLPEEIRDEVAPKNILMIGPTGCGKTEIARRLAKLCGAPFIKVEATKYTEVGYVGRDVESMVRDLMAVGYNDVKAEMEDKLREKSVSVVEERLLDLLLPGSNNEEKKDEKNAENQPPAEQGDTREKFRQMLRDGKLENREIDLIVKRPSGGPNMEIITGGSIDDLQNSMQGILNIMNGSGRGKKRSVTVKEARKIIEEEVLDSMVDRHDSHGFPKTDAGHQPESRS